MPVSCHADGRSPLTRPTITGTAAPRVKIGPMMLITPIASAWKLAAMATTLSRPAAIDGSSTSSGNAWPRASTTSDMRTRPASWLKTITVQREVRRVWLPARTSPAA